MCQAMPGGKHMSHYPLFFFHSGGDRGRGVDDHLFFLFFAS